MSIKVTEPVKICVDNIGMVINSSDLKNPLNKKTVDLVYHFKREHISNTVVEIPNIDTEDNYADALNKALNSKKHSDFLYEFWKTKLFLRYSTLLSRNTM